ncbi:MAG: DUF748 domain-containing protein [Rhodocyclaceae bacterium]
MTDLSEPRKLLSRIPAGRHAKAWRLGLWALGIFVALVAIGFLAVPPLAKWQAQKQLTALLGRNVTVERVAFNPLMLSVTVEGLRIAEADGKSDFVKVGRAYANLQLSSIFRGAVLERIQIDQPDINLVRLPDNRYNFSDIVDRLNARPKSPDTGEPAHFSLNNIELHEGRVSVDDRVSGVKHLAEHIDIGVPFVSNLPAQVETFVQPKLDAVINGSHLSLAGRARPFADRREADIKIALAPFEVSQYLAYAPDSLPVKIQQGKLGVDIDAVWTQQHDGAQALVLSGKVDVADARVDDTGGAQLLAFDKLAIDIKRLTPLAHPLELDIARVALDAPQLAVSRHADGSINLASLGGKQKAPAKPAADAKPAPAPKVHVGEVAIANGEVRWHDEAVPKGFNATLGKLEASLKGFDLSPQAAPAVFSLKAQSDAGEALSLDGSFDAHFKTDGKFALAGISVDRYRPYFATAVGDVAIGGKVEAGSAFSFVPEGKDAGFALREGKLHVSDVNVAARGSRRPTLKLAELTLDGLAVAPAKREFSVDRVSSRDAQWEVARARNGDFDILTMWPQPEKQAPAAAKDNASAAPWKVRVGGTRIENWGLRFDNQYGTTRVVTRLDQIGLELGEYATDGKKPVSVGFKARSDSTGSIQIAGNVQPQPAKGRLTVDLRNINLLAAQPYVDREYRVLITQGRASVKGTVDFDLTRPDTPQVAFAGDFGITDLNSLDRVNNTDFVRWKNLQVTRLRTSLSPLSVEASEIRLDAAYSRLILSADGNINLREVAQPMEGYGDKPEQVEPAPATSAGSTTVAAPSKPIKVRIDRVAITDSNINYSDRLVRPNFDANLTEVNGTLSGLSSDQASVAKLDLKAAVDHAAPVTVVGELNPFRQDRYLDIKAQVDDVDLTSVSTYAVKYVGYGIEKGKLSMKLDYQIRERKLTAQNQVYIDQLTFGERVDSPTATKLPVLLAVALLKDRNGVIDVNLPVSGTLDDPEFSVGGLIVRVIVNLIGKAVTAPFSLLGSVFSGGNPEELSYIEFAPGDARLPAGGEEKLKALSKALIDRPALRLQVTGRADAATDVTGLKRETLNARMRAVKASEMVRRGQSVNAVERTAYHRRRNATSAGNGL